MDENRIFIVTGDVSGDMHGAFLAKSLLKKESRLEIFGMGGEKMKAAGVKVLFDLTRFSLMGFVEVIRHIFLFRRVFYQLVTKIRTEQPQAIIFIDYPGFNLRLAEKIKPLSIPLIYYITPQVWAWGKNRIKKLSSLVSAMIVILPFEKEIYEKQGLPTFFVGHPLLDVVKTKDSMTQSPTKNVVDELARRSTKVDHYINRANSATTISILPGSRSCEVKRLLPVMIRLAQLIKERKPEVRFVILAANSLIEKQIEKILKSKKISLKITQERKYDLIKRSTLVLTASGTATVEIAILERPMIILYKVSPLAYPFLKKMIKLPYIGMVNIIAKKKIVPEFIQGKANAEKILPTALGLLEQREKRKKMSEQLRKVKESLGNTGATDRAAEIILKSITNLSRC